MELIATVTGHLTTDTPSAHAAFLAQRADKASHDLPPRAVPTLSQESGLQG